MFYVLNNVLHRELKSKEYLGYLVIDVDSCIIEQTGTSTNECWDNLQQSWQQCFEKLWNNQVLFNTLTKKIPSSIIKQEKRKIDFDHIKNNDIIRRLDQLNFNSRYYVTCVNNEQVIIFYSLNGYLSSLYGNEKPCVWYNGQRKYNNRARSQYFGRHKAENLSLKIIIIKNKQMKDLSKQLRDEKTLEQTKHYLDKTWNQPLSWDSFGI